MTAETRARDTNDVSRPAAGDADLLQTYKEIKLEIAAIIRKAMDWVPGRGRQLLARLAEDRSNLAVIGKFNRGKSTLMNAVLGSEHLPVGVLPQTSVITTVCYGSRERLLIRRKDRSLPQELPIADLWQYVSEKGNPANRKEVTLAEVQLPAEILRQGFYFIDTPGVGSMITANTATTESFIPEADAVIFVTSFDSPLGEDEMDLLRAVRRHVRKIYVVINKQDLVSLAERHDVLDFIRKRLETESEELPELFAVSARDGLSGKISHIESLFLQSGLPELEKSLIRFLTREKAREFLLRVADRAADLLECARAEASLRARARQGPQEAAARMKQFKDRVELLRREHQEISERLQGRTARELRGRLQQQLDTLCAEARTAATMELDSCLSQARMFRDCHWQEMETKVRGGCANRLRVWLSERREEFGPMMEEMLGDDLGQLRSLADEAVQSCFELFELHPSDSAFAGSPEDTQESDPALFADPPDFPWTIRVQWWLYFVPVRWRRKIVRRRCCQSVDLALTEYQNAIYRLFLKEGNAWIDWVSRMELARINTSAERMEKVISSQLRPEELSAMETLRARLEKIRADLGAEDPAPSTRSVPFLMYQESNLLPARAIRPCPICSRVVESLLDFMGKYQYELAVSESVQAEHAETGGFCPLHTWQYERMASPQGICAGYPQVLSRLAERLRSEASVPSPSDNAFRLLAQHDTCPACRIVSAAEEAALRSVLDILNSPAGSELTGLPVLCTPHLFRLLSMASLGDNRKHLLRKQAQVLERIAEDMQQHVMKHQAIKRSLMTEEELRAHTHGLSLLAGHPTLSVSRRD